VRSLSVGLVLVCGALMLLAAKMCYWFYCIVFPAPCDIWGLCNRCTWNCELWCSSKICHYSPILVKIPQQ